MPRFRLPKPRHIACGLLLSAMILPGGTHAAGASTVADQADGGTEAALQQELQHLAPEGVIVDSVRQQGAHVRIEGHAPSNKAVSAFLDALRATSDLSDVDLESVAVDQGKITFKASCKRTPSAAGVGETASP